MKAKVVEAFKRFLDARGAEVLVPTNEWEVLRFRANGAVSVIYRNKAGGHTFTGEAVKAFEAYSNNKPWVSEARQRNGRPNGVSVKIRTLLHRDGNRCFYCFLPIPPGEESIEHLLPLAHGGTHHLSNLVLAHRPCNTDAGHLPIMTKIKRREEHGLQLSNAVRAN